MRSLLAATVALALAGCGAGDGDMTDAPDTGAADTGAGGSSPDMRAPCDIQVADLTGTAGWFINTGFTASCQPGQAPQGLGTFVKGVDSRAPSAIITITDRSLAGTACTVTFTEVVTTTGSCMLTYEGSIMIPTLR